MLRMVRIQGRVIADVTVAGITTQGVVTGRMTAGATATTRRNAVLQIRNTGMAKGAIVPMRDDHGRILPRSRIVTNQAGGRNHNIADRHMVDIAVSSQFLVGMASQTIGRVGTQGDGINDILSWTSMTGGAGTVSVGCEIVKGLDGGPVRRRMTTTTGQPRCRIREVIGPDLDWMLMVTMVDSIGRMAVETADLDAIQPLRNGLADNSGVKDHAGVVMTKGTVGPVQYVNICSADQGAAAG